MNNETEKTNSPKSSYTKAQRVLAWVGIGLLVAMYLTNIIFALTDNEYTGQLTMCSVVLTILIPIMLYCFIMMTKKRHPKKEDGEETIKK